MHATPVRDALVDDLGIPDGDAIDDPAGSWGAGPYGEAARDLLAAHAGVVDTVSARYRRLGAAVAGRPERFVVTHGEPHPGNTITTDDGVVLVDWDTALVAAPERDLWLLADDDLSVLDAYADATGVDPDLGALELYRLRWWLADLAAHVRSFRRAHRRSADTEASWANLERCLTAPPT